MSYPQFNLTTLQLPAPASNMTKAEYKAAYGIDLDDVSIKAFKLVLLGNEKYPIDQIKEVEGGYEIYFNGRILSITDIVQTSDEVYDVANSKPIYFHPVTIYDGENENRKVALSLFILNNSPTEFTKDTLVSFLKGLTGARFLLTGSIYESTFYLSPAFVVNVGNVLYVIGVDSTGLRHDTSANTIILDTLLTTATLYDGVNKIN